MAEAKKEKENTGSISQILARYARETLRHPWLLFLVFAGNIVVQTANVIAPTYLRTFFNILSSGTPGDAAVSSLHYALYMAITFWLISWVGQRVRECARSSVLPSDEKTVSVLVALHTT